MKKISICALLTLLTLPGFAETSADAGLLSEESLTPVATTASDVLAEEPIATASTVTVSEAVPAVSSVSVNNEYTQPTNPEIKFPHGLQLGVGISATGGVNGFVGYENKKFDSFWAKRFGVRLDFATTRPLKSKIDSLFDSVVGDDGIDVGDNLTVKDISLKSQHVAAMLDFYPFGDTWFLGGWRITGGYYTGKLKIDANLTGELKDLPDSEFAFMLGDNQYRYTGNEINGTARANWNYRGPYVGAGFDWGLGAGLKVYLDAGVVFTDKTAQLDLSVPKDALQTWNGSAWVAVEGNTALEEAFETAKADTLKDAQDELDKLKYYPIIKLGLMYRF